MINLRIPPPIQGIFWGVSMWVVSHVLPQYNFGFSGQKPLGFIIIGMGFLFDLVSIRSFFQVRTTVNPVNLDKVSKLVTTGLYQISRNPMYLGLALILSGWGILLGNIINLIMFCLFILLMNILQIKPEEAVLSEKFGAEYQMYRQSVRRWI